MRGTTRVKMLLMRRRLHDVAGELVVSSLRLWSHRSDEKEQQLEEKDDNDQHLKATRLMTVATFLRRE